MRSLTLDHLTEIYALTELEAAVALFHLFSGNFSIHNSSDELNAQRQRIHRAKERGFFQNFKNFLLANQITDLFKYFRLSVHFWHCPNNGVPMKNLVPKIVRSIHTDGNLGVLNLLVDRKTFDIKCNESFTKDLRLITDHDYLKHLREQMKTFKENVALSTGRPAADLAWLESFSVIDERKFANKYSIGFELWVVDAKYCLKNKEVVMTTKCIYKSSQPNYIVLQFVGNSWDNEKEMITSSDLFILRDASAFQIFKCPEPWCFYNTTSSRDFEKHSCKNTSTVKYKQICFTNESPKEFLVRTKVIPNYESFNLVTIDIETLNDPENKQISEFTFLKSTHKLLSISITSNFAGSQTKVLTREDFSEKSLMQIIRELWDHLVYLQIEHEKSFPREFHSALESIQAKISEKPAFKASSKLISCRRYLRKLFALKVLTYNGETRDSKDNLGALLEQELICLNTHESL